ncbi:transcriptional regulator domain-containing protein [Tritonibacter scottomollicae]|uniref:transcriptional regulator domain-containing protein n=1 Tax=Tritonibacter scottomollicae TaxID=483013 RepID=UPI003AA914D4
MARSFDSNDRTGGFDFSEFAQEFLRRNPAYRQQYARIASNGGVAARSAACRRMARSWGLEFPDRSRTFGFDRSGDLAKRSQRARRNPDRRRKSL